MDSEYTVFSKAFDVVNHDLLIAKLQVLDINGSIWTQIFVTSGVPQESYLGPAVFLLFLNDMLRVIHYSHRLLFVDEFKRCKVVDSVDDAELWLLHLSNLSRWCDKTILRNQELSCLHLLII